jgi:hypothetical protein
MMPCSRLFNAPVFAAGAEKGCDRSLAQKLGTKSPGIKAEAKS